MTGHKIITFSLNSINISSIIIIELTYLN
jgi:hypothetical protein